MLIRWKNKDKSSSSGSSGSGRNTQTLPASAKTSSKKKRKFGKGEDWEKGREFNKSAESFESRGDEEVRRSRNRREDPRRHTLSGEHTQFAAQQMLGSNEFESTLPRCYPLHNSTMLFDDDPGIMSEVETSSTGFRRGGKQRSSLPVVRTPSKTLERPLGLVFLQYRSETKRALLPNEITSIDTVKALFVRSFSKQLTMEYLDSPMVKIYIHDSSKDMFYELEDLRSHLRDIRDRSVLRLFEATDVNGGNLSSTLSIAPPTWDQDQSYFSEPEFDSEFQHQHIHKTKGSKISAGVHASYYMPVPAASFPRGTTLPRNYNLAKTTPAPYDDSYYQYPSRTGSITPVIDEETSDSELMDDTYSLSYGIKVQPGGPVRPYTTAVIPPYDTTRIRVEHMERQLANLTGLVQKALTHSPSPSPREVISMGLPPTYRPGPAEDVEKHTGPCISSLPDNKSVSFEKSVSFSEDPPTNSPKQHSPQHTVDSKPSKPAIKSSTLPRTSSQERDRHKTVHLKPLASSGLAGTGQCEPEHNVYRGDLQLTPEMYNQLRGLQKKAKDLREDMRNLRRMSQAQAHSTRESIKDTFIKIRAILMSGNDDLRLFSGDSEFLRINREEDLYKQEMLRLESDLTDLETTVEVLRGNVINRKTRVNMSDVENMALVLSKSSKTVAELKIRFPGLQNSIKTLLNKEVEKVLSDEIFIKDEPERLENALRRCKKLTGTLVTLKRLASVQEQRLPDARLSPTTDDPSPMFPNKTPSITGTSSFGENEEKPGNRCVTPRAENALDVLLDELQTFSQPPTAAVLVEHSSTLRRLRSYPSGDSKPPVPERSSELLSKRVPPPPPPRTSSKSPLASPTNPMAPARNAASNVSSPIRQNTLPKTADNSSGQDKMSSQLDSPINQPRQEYLEQKHQELLRKQRALQEQYTRLQRTPPPDLIQLKKTGSEGNIIQKMGLGLAASAPMSGSMSHFGYFKTSAPVATTDLATATTATDGGSVTSKLYETDIL